MINAVIPARGGSKEIPKKNIKYICGKPLIAWSIEHCLSSEFIDMVWVSSDSSEILEIASEFGAQTILRPPEISTDSASSESAWIHAVEKIFEYGTLGEIVVGIQATSPIRDPDDLDNAIRMFVNDNLDSLFSANIVKDFFQWKSDKGVLAPLNYDPQNRKPRQFLSPTYLENGSFYLFNSSGLLREKCRLFGKIGAYVQKDACQFQVDSYDDLEFVERLLEVKVSGKF